MSEEEAGLPTAFPRPTGLAQGAGLRAEAEPGRVAPVTCSRRRSSRGIPRLEPAADVTDGAAGGPRTMLALLGAATLGLLAGALRVSPAAAGERIGTGAGSWVGHEGWAAAGGGQEDNGLSAKPLVPGLGTPCVREPSSGVRFFSRIPAARQDG